MNKSYTTFYNKKMKIVAALNEKIQNIELVNSKYKGSMQQDFQENYRKHLTI